MDIKKGDWQERLLGVPYPYPKDLEEPPCNGSIAGRLRWAIRNLEAVVEVANSHLQNDWLHRMAQENLGGSFVVNGAGQVMFQEKAPLSVDEALDLAESTPPGSVILPTEETSTEETPTADAAPKKKLPSIKDIRAMAENAGVDISDLGVSFADKEEALRRVEAHQASPEQDLPEETPEETPEDPVEVTPPATPEPTPEPPQKMVKQAPAVGPTTILPEPTLEADPYLCGLGKKAPTSTGPSLSELIATSATMDPDQVATPEAHDPDWVDNLVPEDTPEFPDEDADPEDNPPEEESTQELDDDDVDNLVESIAGDEEKSVEAVLDELF